MKYYKTTCDKLIQFNPETNVYKIRNNIKHIDTRLSKEDFDKLDSRQIKMNEFSRLMNVFFKNVKHSWNYNGTNFRKLDNFETDGFKFSTNYEIGKDVPIHDLSNGKEYAWNNRLIMVYHWGRIYYHTISYNGEGVGQLINPKTKELVRWCRLKHCSPIFNENTKQII